jgi:hypothetical protein
MLVTSTVWVDDLPLPLGTTPYEMLGRLRATWAPTAASRSARPAPTYCTLVSVFDEG